MAYLPYRTLTRLSEGECTKSGGKKQEKLLLEKLKRQWDCLSENRLSQECERLQKYLEKLEQNNNLRNPQILYCKNKDEIAEVTWDCIQFGSYPQREIKSSSSKLDRILYYLLEGREWNNENEILYCGTKYKRIRKRDLPFSSKMDGYYPWEKETEWHYFEFAPIKWRILAVKDDELLLLSDCILDTYCYHNSRMEITWGDSEIRSWLNGYEYHYRRDRRGVKTHVADTREDGFINVAFSIEEKKAIAAAGVEEIEERKDPATGEKDFLDKIFLLSEAEVIQTKQAFSYGFSEKYGGSAKERQSENSDYAYARGLQKKKDHGFWWLRTPGISPVYGEVVEGDGSLGKYGYVERYFGVRPALYLKRAAFDLYTLAGTVNIKKEETLI